MIHIHTHNIYIHIYVQMNFSIGESQKHSEVKQPGTKEYIPYDPIFIKSRDDQTNSDRKQIHAFLGLCVQVGVSRGVTEVSVAMQTPQSSSVMWLDRGTHLRELSSSILSTRACPVVQSCPTLSQLQELYPSRLLCPCDFPGKHTGVGRHFLLQRIFPTQGSNPRLLHLLCWPVSSLPLSRLGSPPKSQTVVWRESKLLSSLLRKQSKPHLCFTKEKF